MIPLEDNVGDIIGKAQRGLGISDSQLAEKSARNFRSNPQSASGRLRGSRSLERFAHSRP